MNRRKAITMLGGAAAAWPLTARAQQPERMRRVAMLIPFAETDAGMQLRVHAFREELRKLGWMEGGNLELDQRWTTDDMNQVRANAANLLELRPDVVITTGGRVIPIFKQMTQTVPIIMMTADPVGAGLVESLARPGGNITGFSVFEFSLIGKTLEILKKIVPEISRVAMIYNRDNPTTSFFVRSFETYSGPLALEPITKPIHGFDDFDRVITMMAQQPNVGILFPLDVTINRLRAQVVAAVARHRLPAI